MCDVGALAMAKDQGPIPGFGRVVWPESAAGWELGRMSQEHGTLTKTEGAVDVKELPLGQVLRIVGQHAW
jgi:D-serine deaminase-like pyridoxal phosphate-dependent protein